MQWGNLSCSLRQYAQSRELVYSFDRGWVDLRDLLIKAADRIDELETKIEDMDETIDEVFINGVGDE